jgi:hypothetical protein
MRELTPYLCLPCTLLLKVGGSGLYIAFGLLNPPIRITIRRWTRRSPAIFSPAIFSPAIFSPNLCPRSPTPIFIKVDDEGSSLRAPHHVSLNHYT